LIVGHQPSRAQIRLFFGQYGHLDYGQVVGLLLGITGSGYGPDSCKIQP
jgi:hypothetical protein